MVVLAELVCVIHVMGMTQKKKKQGKKITYITRKTIMKCVDHVIKSTQEMEVGVTVANLEREENGNELSCECHWQPRTSL